MNERTLKLFMKACRHADYEHQNVPKELVEKFSELIVKECLHNMENCDGDLDFAIWKTKQDFGVEE